MFSICVLMLSGCASTYVDYVPAENRIDSNSAAAQGLKILETAPSEAYTLMGTFNVKGSSRKEIISVLKEKAYQLGADALIELEFQNENKEKGSAGKKGAYASSDLLWDVSPNKLGFAGSIAAQAKAIKYVKEGEK